MAKIEISPAARRAARRLNALAAEADAKSDLTSRHSYGRWDPLVDGFRKLQKFKRDVGLFLEAGLLIMAADIANRDGGNYLDQVDAALEEGSTKPDDFDGIV